MPKGGKRPGAGQKGYGKQMAVREGVERLTPRWFQMIEEMLDAKPDEGFTETIKELAKELVIKDTYYGKELIKWMARGAIEDRKFALDQLGKLMNKLMPTELSGVGGGPIEITGLEKLTDEQLDAAIKKFQTSVGQGADGKGQESSAQSPEVRSSALQATGGQQG